MARAQLANNASTTLSAAITSTTATTFTVTSAAAFPTLSTSGYFYCTLLDGANIPEIVKVTGVSGTTFTCTRGADNTTARTFTSGATVSLNITAAVLAELWNEDKVAAAASAARNTTDVVPVVDGPSGTSRSLSIYALANALAGGCVGNFSGLTVSVASGATLVSVSFNAASIGSNTIKSGGIYDGANLYSGTSAAETLTANAGATLGAANLDTGTWAANTWYYIYVIYGTVADAATLLFSTSSTWPTLPTGYTSYLRVGSLLTGSTNNTIVPFIQRGRSVQYLTPRNIASGTLGSVTTPTFVAEALTSYIPSTASRVRGYITQPSGSGIAYAAPNSSYGSYSSTTNPVPCTVSGTQSQAPYDFLIESMNLYVASNSTFYWFILGWEDNI